jgi:magnesium transporter
MLNTYSTTAGGRGPQSARRVWFDLLDPTAEEAARVADESGIQVPSRESLQEIEASSRVRADGKVLYLSMPLASADDPVSFVAVPLGFVLSPQTLITVRYSELPAFTHVQEQLRASPHADSAGVFASLIEAMVDYGADMLEKLSSELASVSARAFSPTPPPRRDPRARRTLRVCLTEVGTAGDRSSRIRESLLGLQRITGFVSELGADWLAPELQVRLKTVRQDLSSLVDFEAHLAGKTQFLLDAILGFISIEQNDIFKVLTIVSVVGIPPTLIASMYGMNFHYMPELGWHYGYAYGLGLIALSTLVPIIWFKRRGWW